MTDSDISELLRYLQIGARLDLKALALEHFLGLTGTEPGIEMITEIPQANISLISLLSDSSAPVAKDAALCLVNISANVKAAEKLLYLDIKQYAPPLTNHPEDIVATCLKFIFDKKSKLADPCCMILSNITRVTHLCEKVVHIIEKSDSNFDDIINIFTKKQYNEVGGNLHYLGPVLSNLSQNSRVRKYILDKEKCVIQRLLPFTEYKESLVRRGGVVGTLKNCCFANEFHSWLLYEVDILPSLLLPLAGNEEFDEDDNDKLPLELQYLPQDKTREEDPGIRLMLIEAVMQLCSQRENREYVRAKNTYVILRELHKWEKDKNVLFACENLVDILIRTESEIGKDNLKEVEVPQYLSEDFQKADEAFLKEP